MLSVGVKHYNYYITPSKEIKAFLSLNYYTQGLTHVL